MDILDIFYNQIVNEAITGRVDCYFFCNTLFNTKIIEENKFIQSEVNYNDVIIPALIIKDKKMFDLLLIKYVEIAKEFYKEDKYIKRISEENSRDISEEMINKIIMTLLWSNATIEDFNNPISFLQKRIFFLETKFDDIRESYGYSRILDGNIELKIEKDMLINETPHKMVFSLNKENNNYYFPEVKFGISDGVVYIYAIQNTSQELSDYTKKVNRALYKIGEGFDASLDNFGVYEEGNLKDVTASFLVSLNMAIAYFKDLGYSKFVVPSILPVRWNAKSIGIDRVSKNTEERKEEQNKIQDNLTNKYIRTFLRLQHHYDGVDILSYPYELDSNLTVLFGEDINSNNSLLNETFELINANKKSHKL